MQLAGQRVALHSSSDMLAAVFAHVHVRPVHGFVTFLATSLTVNVEVIYVVMKH